MTLLEMLRAAGPVFVVLVCLSVFVLYLWISRYQVLRRLGGGSDGMLVQVRRALVGGSLEAARQAVNPDSSLGNVVGAGLERSHMGQQSVVLAMNEASLYEEGRLMKHVSLLATVATIAPMLGLLGTVLGMIHAFQVFSTTANPGPGLLANGIAEALINTAAGLIVAMLAYWGRNHLKTRAEEILLQLDRVREALPDWLAEGQNHRRSQPDDLIKETVA